MKDNIEAQSCNDGTDISYDASENFDDLSYATGATEGNEQEPKETKLDKNVK